MAVDLKVNDSIDPSTNISDSLEGGGTGLDLGSVVSASYAPLTDINLNQGKQDLYIQHDGTNKITNLRVFIGTFGVGTGFTYGGQRTAATDFTNLKALGNASGSSKNNADGNSGGLWMDMDWSHDDSSRFDVAVYPDEVKIFGDNAADGIDLGSAFTIVSEAMSYSAPPETAPSAPVDGELGPVGNTVLGDNAHIMYRIYLPSGHGDAGVWQAELVYAYSFTS